MKTISNLQTIEIKSNEELTNTERIYRDNLDNEFMPWAKNTSFSEVVNNILKDKDGPWENPLYYTISTHRASFGIQNICFSANEFFNQSKSFYDIDVISISAVVKGSKIELRCLVRPYTNNFSFEGFFDYIGDVVEEKIEEYKPESGKLIIPDEIKNFKITPEMQAEHDKNYKLQGEAYRNATKEVPFLNQIDHYTPKKIPTPMDSTDLIYDLKTSDRKISTVSTYEQFTKVFEDVMSYVNGVEYYHYVNVILGEGKTEEAFLQDLKRYVEDYYVKRGKFNEEDVPILMSKLYRSLFKLYVIQDLVDDPNVTDIKITGPDAIRARIKGKAYMSNIHFIDRNDYLRFINMIALRNRISQNVPSQTFTDINDERYIIRFSITAEYVNSVMWPYLHVRKIDRHKLLAPELIEAGMFDEKLRDYLLDCGKNSRGVVFCGPPGSGKTVCLNWFLEEAYEQSAEILVIQENDELFCYRKGVMFQHVVNYARENQQPVSLEQLGKLALVAGANVFIIGEAKGAEICSAITLSNSGCRTAITIHSNSSTDTIDKMADLAMRGYATDYTQAKRMLRSFQTIVYLEDFKIREISEITGFNEETQDMTYRYIYRDPNWKNRGIGR